MQIIAFPAFKNFRSNPYNYMLYSKIGEFGQDVIEYRGNWKKLMIAQFFIFTGQNCFSKEAVIIAFFRSIVKTFILFYRARRRGIKFVWTIHNLKPHEERYPFLERLYWTGMAKCLHGVIALSKDGLQLARNNLPAIASVPSFVIPHGHYRDIYPRTLTRSEARDALGISHSARVVASVGQLRSYKNIPELIRAFRDMDEPDANLLICGRPSGIKIRKGIQSLSQGDHRIRLYTGWIKDEDLQLYFLSADILVFPYRDILNSGSALLGLSFDRPILVPRLGAMAELQKLAGTEWIRLYEGKLDAAILGSALTWAISDKRQHQAPLDDLSWSSIAQQTIAAYRTIAGDTCR